jgi:hypothetical protein
VARLVAEAPPGHARDAAFGAAYGGGRIAALWNAQANVVNEALRKPAADLTLADARSYASSQAIWAPAEVRSFGSLLEAAGFSVMEHLGMWMTSEPLAKKMPSDAVPTRMLMLLVELLKSGELPELAIGGAWAALQGCPIARSSVGLAAVECGMIELAAAHLNAIGSPADWLSISRGKAGRAGRLLDAVDQVRKVCAGQAVRPDLEVCVSSGFFDLCVEAVAAFAAAGEAGLEDTNVLALYMALSAVRDCRAQPGCEPKIRSVASALGFCLEHDLDFMKELGGTTGGNATQICECPSQSPLPSSSYRILNQSSPYPHLILTNPSLVFTNPHLMQL